MRAAAGGIALGTLVYVGASGRLPRPRRPSERQRALLAAAAVSAAAEEIVWRGVLLRLLRRWRPGSAVAATGAGFALSHLPGAGGRALVTLAVLGGALGVVASRRGGLLAAVAAHATYDVLVLLEEPAP